MFGGRLIEFSFDAMCNRFNALLDVPYQCDDAASLLGLIYQTTKAAK
jgi:hypothetical protein